MLRTFKFVIEESIFNKLVIEVSWNVEGPETYKLVLERSLDTLKLVTDVSCKDV